MKRFMKGCGIMALIFAALGFVLAMAGGSIAGRTKIADVVESATGGRVHMNPATWWMWGTHVGDGVLNAEFDDVMEQAVDRGWEAGPVTGYETVQDSDPMFSRSYDIITGSRDKYCPGDGIAKLDIEAGGCVFYTEESDDEHIWLEVMDAHRFQAYVKDGTLHIKTKSATVSDWAEGYVILYLPVGYGFQDVDMEMGAGNFTFTDLNAAEVSLEVGAGQLDIQDIVAEDLDVSVGAGYVWISDMQVNKLDVEIGMGAFSAYGAVDGDVDVECSMGNVEMTLEGSEQDFNYSLEGAMGMIQLGNNSYGGIAEEMDINNRASKGMDIECAMGNVSIIFID